MARETEKRTAGRPATGRDPTVTIRIPMDLLARVHGFQRSMKLTNDRVTVSDILREAIHLGLDHIAGEKPHRGYYLPPGLRPEHSAEIHEAGHAVALFLLAEAKAPDLLSAAPDAVVKKIVLKAAGAGATYWGESFFDLYATPLDRLHVNVAGAVADSLHRGIPFDVIWRSKVCRGDRSNTIKGGYRHQDDIDDAAREVRQKFEQPDVWSGLLTMASGLTHEPRTGSQCWYDFNYGRTMPDGRE